MVDEQVPWKVFTQALVAPTLLVAIIHQGGDINPHTAVETPAASPIRQLSGGSPDSSVPGRPAAAPGITPLAGPPSEDVVRIFHAAYQVPVQILVTDSVIRFGRTDLGSGLASGARLLAGRETTREAWVYVLGQSPGPARASAVATRLRAALPGLDIRLLQPEGDTTVFLTVQGFLTAESAQQLSARVRNLTYERLAATGTLADQARRDLVLLGSGTVVSALSLIEQSEARSSRARQARRPD
jgi:hypothetical protein